MDRWLPFVCGIALSLLGSLMLAAFSSALFHSICFFGRFDRREVVLYVVASCNIRLLTLDKLVHVIFPSLGRLSRSSLCFYR